MNSDKQVAVYDNEVSARDYISYIAEQAGGFASIGRDAKLYIKTIGEDTAELPLKYFQDFTWGEAFKISRVQYEDGVQLFETGDTTSNTVYISQDNMYIVDQEQVDSIYEKLGNLEIYSFEGSCMIDPALDVGDILKIDQTEGTITQLTQETTEHEQKITQHEQDINSLKQSVSNAMDYKRELCGATELHIADAGRANILKLEVKGNKTYATNVFPRSNLYPSSNLYSH